MNINYKTKTDILLEDIKDFNIGKAEKEYMDCLIHITELLQKKLDIAVKALNRMIGNPPTNFPDCETYMWEALQALKEIDLVGTSMSQAKED